MRILHLTDIHYKANKPDKAAFHTKLADYIKKYFSENPIPDAVVLSGDFGDQCLDSNVTGAIDWLKDLLSTIGVAEDSVIVSPGNHDIIKCELPFDHHTARLDYGRAITHMENLGVKEYAAYNRIRQEIAPSSCMTKVIKDVRFITLNSSWLTQYRDDAKDELIKELLEESNGDDILIAQSVFEKFGASFTVDGVTKTEDTRKPLPILDHILNLSENKTQQLGLYKKYTDLNKLLSEMDDKKLNVLVFHHPETHLHPFERYPVEIANEVYSTYYNLTLKSQLLLCGHTHPSEAEDIANFNRYLQHNFVGGGAHLRDGIDAATPMFYIYDITGRTDSKVFEIEKLMFVFDKDNFKPDTTNKSMPVRITMTQGRTKASEEDYVIPRIDIKGFLLLKAQLRKYLADSLLKKLKRVDPSFSLSRKYEIIDVPRDAVSTYNILRHRSLFESEKARIPIIFDTYFCDELDFGPERETVAKLIKAGYEQQEKRSCIYYPLFVNPYCAFVKGKRVDETSKRIKDDLDLFCSDYDIVVKGIYSSLRAIYPQIAELTDITFEQGLLHIDDKTCLEAMGVTS